MRATLALVLLAVATPAAAKPAATGPHLAGTIAVARSAATHVKAGGTVFVLVKAADSDGNAVGMPLAVARLQWKRGGVKFLLPDKDSMLADHPLAGDVVVIARFDQDGDALTKQPGDVEGRARAAVPADGVQIVLDELIP